MSRGERERGCWGAAVPGRMTARALRHRSVNVFEAVLHQQECGRNLRRSRVLELLCPEAPRLAVLWLQGSPARLLPGSKAPRRYRTPARRLQGSTAASHPCPLAPALPSPPAPGLRGSEAPRPPRIPAPALRHRYPSRTKPNRVGLNSGKIWSMAALWSRVLHISDRTSR